MRQLLRRARQRLLRRLLRTSRSACLWRAQAAGRRVGPAGGVEASRKLQRCLSNMRQSLLLRQELLRMQRVLPLLLLLLLLLPQILLALLPLSLRHTSQPCPLPGRADWAGRVMLVALADHLRAERHAARRRRPGRARLRGDLGVLRAPWRARRAKTRRRPRLRRRSRPARLLYNARERRQGRNAPELGARLPQRPETAAPHWPVVQVIQAQTVGQQRPSTAQGRHGVRRAEARAAPVAARGAAPAERLR